MNDIKGFSDNRVIDQSIENREKIVNLQDVMLDMPESATGEEADKLCPLTHHFAPGVYAREIFLPAGVTVVGKLHKHAHLNIISKGSVLVSTEKGNEQFDAPFTFTSYAGTKRAVHALEDTIWTTIHVTDKTDLEEIESEIIAKDYSELPGVDTPDKLEGK